MQNKNILEMFVPPIKNVGKNTYSQPDIQIVSTETVIGKFCSIGPRVILGHGEHPVNYLTTSPYLYFDNLGYKKEDFVSHNEFWISAPINIGNDVWLGDGVFVKNGITIGDGAIVGARSVVTKDVPPYAIVAGVPAKILKYRFSTEIIEQLLELKWWDLDDGEIKKIPYDNIDDAIAYLKPVREIREKINKLCIFFFYDKQGIIDDYIIHFLQKMQEVCSNICVVVNGTLDEHNLDKISPYANKVLLRENKGFDSWAYKHALESYGFEELKNYKEVILCNFTFFGGIFDFKDMFIKMSKRGVDFWGIHRHPKNNYQMAGVDVSEHIQSHFIVIKKEIITSPHFKHYWDTLQMVTNYEEAVAFHELRFTAYFENLGYKSSVYMDKEKYFNLFDGNTSVFTAASQIIEDKCPILKRKTFFVHNDEIQYKNQDRYSFVYLLWYLKNVIKYDVRFILDNLKRTEGIILPDVSNLNPRHIRKIEKIEKISLMIKEGENISEILSSIPKNILIYCVYDKSGIIHDYVISFLTRMDNVLSEICVVINGSITKDNYERLKPYADRIIVRENKGYDAWAFKEGLESYGYEALSEYEQVIIANDTFYGPFYPIDKIFNEMNLKNIDFWGITTHPSVDGFIENVPILEHLQSYFIVFHSNILRHESFKEFWETLKPIDSYTQAVAFFELQLTNFFKHKGFKYDSYIPTEKYFKKISKNASIFHAASQIIEDKNPFLKRKAFILEGNKIKFPSQDKRSILDALRFIRKHTNYDVTLIKDYFLKTNDVKKIPHHRYSFSYIVSWLWASIQPKRKKRIKLKNSLICKADLKRIFKK